MSDFGDLRQYLDCDLTLNVGDKTYTVKAPNAEKGLELRARAVTDQDPDTDLVIGVELLGGRRDNDGKWVKPKGSVFAKLMAEQDWDAVHRVAVTSMVYFLVDRTMAAHYWKTGVLGLPDTDDQESSPQT